MKNRKAGIYVNILIYLYISLPTLIFVIGWLKWYWAIIFAPLISIACTRSFMNSEKSSYVEIENFNMKTILIASIFIALWVYLSGIGGWCYQNSDHGARNTIFRALVEYDWPVISRDGIRGLIYYIGFWLPAACVGKIFGLEAGYTAQVIWSIIGILITYYLICAYRKKMDLLPVAFLVFFSGLDYVGVRLLGYEELSLLSTAHIEWWAHEIQFSCTTTQLFWVFNQAIPAWVSTILVMTQKDCKNILFILSTTMLTSTIPFVGLIPIAIWLYVKRVKLNRRYWKEVFTFQNIIGVVVIGGCVFLYLIGNISGSMIKQDSAQITVIEPAAQWLRYLLFYFLEFGVYLCFICKYYKKNSLIYLITAILLVCPFIKVGGGHDFCMRASIPALFILMLMCMETLEKIYQDKKKALLVGYCVVLLMGAVNPFNEIHRSIQETFQRSVAGQSVRWPESDMDNELLQGGNFSGMVDGNLFYKYFAKSIPSVSYK